MSPAQDWLGAQQKGHEEQQPPPVATSAASAMAGVRRTTAAMDSFVIRFISRLPSCSASRGIGVTPPERDSMNSAQLATESVLLPELGMFALRHLLAASLVMGACGRPGVGDYQMGTYTGGTDEASSTSAVPSDLPGGDATAAVTSPNWRKYGELRRGWGPGRFRD